MEIPAALNVVIMRNVPQDVLKRLANIAPGRIHTSVVSERDESQPQRERMLMDGHVAVVSPACHRDLRARMPQLLWVHAGFAGVSDLNNCDFWGTDILLTSARGDVTTPAIAEMMLTGGLAIAKQLHVASRLPLITWRGGREHYQHVQLLAGKTLGIVGLGGVGSSLARLGKGLGFRVLATRRSADHRVHNVDGVDELFPPCELKLMAAESNFLAVCAASTPETFQMVNSEVLDALPPGAILMNAARGEIVDEDALIARLESGQLGGAYLDCYFGEREAFGPSGRPHDPNPRLSQHPNVVMTPHIATRSDGIHPQVFSFDIFCTNLRSFLEGAPLTNVVDWARGY